jgi:hypothetical protein
MRTRRKRYSAEFKREALKRASEEGITDVRVSEERFLLNNMPHARVENDQPAMPHTL